MSLRLCKSYEQLRLLSCFWQLSPIASYCSWWLAESAPSCRRRRGRPGPEDRPERGGLRSIALPGDMSLSPPFIPICAPSTGQKGNNLHTSSNFECYPLLQICPQRGFSCFIKRKTCAHNNKTMKIFTRIKCESININYDGWNITIEYIFPSFLWCAPIAPLEDGHSSIDRSCNDEWICLRQAVDQLDLYH